MLSVVRNGVSFVRHHQFGLGFANGGVRTSLIGSNNFPEILAQATNSGDSPWLGVAAVVKSIPQSLRCWCRVAAGGRLYDYYGMNVFVVVICVRKITAVTHLRFIAGFVCCLIVCCVPVAGPGLMFRAGSTGSEWDVISGSLGSLRSSLSSDGGAAPEPEPKPAWGRGWMHRVSDVTVCACVCALQISSSQHGEQKTYHPTRFDHL